MATKYPVALDDAVTLGGPFIDNVPPVDPQINIAAEFRNNTNDTVIAIETRLGILNDAATSTVDWGLLTISGTPNQGVRFAGEHATWPGAVGESGIFVDSGTKNVSYHKGGDPVGTFYDLTTGAGGIGSWNDLYAASKTMTINAGDLTWETPRATGSDFVIRDVTFSKEFLRVDSSTSRVIVGSASGSGTDVVIEGPIAGDLIFDAAGFREIRNDDDLGLFAEGGARLLFKARGSSSIELNESGQLVPSTTAQSLVGAINELKSTAYTTWDQLYSNDKILSISGASLEFSGNTANVALHVGNAGAGDAFAVWDGTIGTGTRVFHCSDGGQVDVQINSNTDGFRVGQTKLGPVAAFYDGVVGATTPKLEISKAGKLTSLPDDPTTSFSAFELTMTSGGLGFGTAMSGVRVHLKSDAGGGDLASGMYGINLSFTDQGGSHSSRAVIAGNGWDYSLYAQSPAYITALNTIAKPLLLLNQTDVDEPFWEVAGTYTAGTTATNVTGLTAGTIAGFIRIAVDASTGGGPNQDFWLPFYTIP